MRLGLVTALLPCLVKGTQSSERIGFLVLHGGIGFTWEHPAHLYLRRAKASSALFGSRARTPARRSGLVNLPGPGA